MLVNLHVKNLALIEEENIDFEEGLNILSGETGTGKSIILGSINAALGSKTSPDFIRSGCEYGLSEITFAIPEDKVERIKELGVISCEDGELVISRKIMANRSQIKVNGQSFTSAQTRLLAHELIDIHGQHDNQLLMDESNHLSVIDEYDDTVRPLLDEYKQFYREYTKCKKEYESLSCDDESRIKEMAFLQYEINELESAALKPGEDEQVETDYRRMSNFQKIAGNLSEVSMLLSEGDSNLSDMAGSALKNMIAASEYDENLSENCDILSDIENLISDVAHNLSAYMEDFTFDQSEFNALEERLDLINSLKMKYGNSIENILSALEEKKQKLSEYENYDEVVAKRKAEYDLAFKQLKKSAEKLGAHRRKTALQFAEDIKNALRQLNFLDVRFEACFSEKEPDQAGTDDVRFMISTNPGEDMKPLAKIASGGELSRIMLAIKSVMAETDVSKTLIFDEIDAGISGKTAQLVAEKLNTLSKTHQIICITHLPQIAAMADNHYVIKKSTKDNRTISNITRLSYDESVGELARMLGGSSITEAVVSNAKELKNMAQAAKHN